MSDKKEYNVTLSEAEIEALKNGVELDVERGNVSINIRADCEVCGCDCEITSLKNEDGNLDKAVCCKYCGDVKFSNEIHKEEGGE